MPDPAREPETPDEELLEAETAAIARLYTDDDRVERMAGELRSGFATLSGLRPGGVGVRLRPHTAATTRSTRPRARWRGGWGRRATP